MKDAARQKGFSKFTKNKTEDEKARDRAEWFEKDMPEMLGKIDEAVKETSVNPKYAFGTSTSYADVVIWALIRDCFSADVGDTAKAAEKCLALKAIADQIESNPGVSKWLKERPESMF